MSDGTDDVLPDEVAEAIGAMAETIVQLGTPAEIIGACGDAFTGLPLEHAPDGVLERIIEIVAARDVDGEMLAGMAFAAPPPLRDAAAQRLGGRDTQVGRAVTGIAVGDVWLIEDEESEAVITAVLPLATGEGVVLLHWLLDGLLGGALGDGSIAGADEAAELLAAMRDGAAESGLEPRSISGDELIERIGSAVSANLAAGIAPPPAAVAATHALFGVAGIDATGGLDRLAELPPLPDPSIFQMLAGDETIEALDDDERTAEEERLDDFASEFAKTVEGEHGSVLGDAAWTAASELDGFCIHELGLPETSAWCRDVVRLYLLGFAPLEVDVADPSTFAGLTAAYLRFLAERELMPAHAEALARYAEAIAPQAAEVLADESAWSDDKRAGNAS